MYLCASSFLVVVVGGGHFQKQARLQGEFSLNCVQQEIIKNNKTNILRGGFQSPNGGFQEGPLENKSLKHTINSLKIQK